ncbi:hypothetical protein AAK967_07365 [Atopobiaceae bacterium 24-176]
MFNLVVNGLPQVARFSHDDLEHGLAPLARRITQAGPGPVLVAGAPGSGKSTVALVLERLCAALGRQVPALSMDGFHRSRAWLEAHGLLGRKGAPETFDFDGLRHALVCPDPWPVYSRVAHDVVGKTVRVRSSTFIVEGNYLLLDEEPWRQLSQLSPLTVWVDVDPWLLRERLVGRKVAGGMDRAEAERFFEESDSLNVRRCLERRLPAHVELRLTPAEEL